MKLEEKVKQYFGECIEHRYSDLFLLPKDDFYQLLYKQQNHYQKVEEISKSVAEQIMSYIKFLADMSISEHRRPQSGAIDWHTDEDTVNLRISTVGDFLDRESMVIRFIYSLTEYSDNVDLPGWQAIKDNLSHRGLVVFAGPMGSGKTTSIYQLAEQLSKDHLVMTIEDPVEIKNDAFIQLQVNEEAGMNYPRLLKTGLRHRPDVFIIGEIRDKKTAEAAVQAALSGHLVMTTIHAVSVKGIWQRLLELGIKESFLKQIVNTMVYQRLIPLKNDQNYLMMDIESDFIKEKLEKWRDKLGKLYENKQISTEIFEKYQFG